MRRSSSTQGTSKTRNAPPIRTPTTAAGDQPRSSSDRASEPERREAWLRDQYRHPEEHSHSVAEVRRWFRANGIDYVSTYPSTLIGEEPDDLLAPAEDEWPLESVLAQLGWMGSLGGEGGLFVMVGRKPI